MDLSFREKMSGSYYLLSEPLREKALVVSIRATLGNPLEFARTRTFQIAGEITAEGLVESAAFEGSLGLKLFDERRVPYSFRFRLADGRKFELRGQKEWTPLSPVQSLSTLNVGLYDDAGTEVGRGVLRFDLQKDTIGLIRSIRIERR